MNYVPNDPRLFTSRSLLLLSVGSALFYLALTLLILRFVQDTSIFHLFEHGLGVTAQIVTGTVCGLTAALLIGAVMFRTSMSEILQDYQIITLLSQIRLNGPDRVQISLFAGMGEELLFRGALQPILGIWVTSVIFVAVHGYFKFISLRHIAFGFTMFLLSMGLGVLFEYAGLIAAMTAHAVYDVVMLQIGHRLGFVNRDFYQ